MFSKRCKGGDMGERRKIAFTGIAGSGKDFLVSHVVSMGYKRKAFADVVKEISSELYPWMAADYPAFEKEKIIEESPFKVTPREVWLSMNSLKTVDPDIFLNKFIKNYNSCDDDIVISDVRTPNEFQWCTDNGFELIFVEPIKQIYEPNDYDGYIPSFRDRCGHIFVNNFNGIDEFEKFYNDKLI